MVQDKEDTVDDRAVKTGRVESRGSPLTPVQRAMLRIMNDHGVPIDLIQKSFDCQRATVLGNITQTRLKNKDDTSEDYREVIRFAQPKITLKPHYKKRKAIPEDDREFVSTKRRSKGSPSLVRRTARITQPSGPPQNKTASSQPQPQDKTASSRPQPEPDASSTDAGGQELRQFLSRLPLDLSGLYDQLANTGLTATKGQLSVCTEYDEASLKQLLRDAAPGMKEFDIFVIVKGLLGHVKKS